MKKFVAKIGYMVCLIITNEDNIFLKFNKQTNCPGIKDIYYNFN